MELPEELKEAIQVLGQAEKTKTPKTAISKFNQGIEIFEDYLEENPNNQYFHQIKNLIISYTRVIISKVIQYTNEGLFEDDFGLWIDYLIGLLSVQKYIDEIIVGNQELKNGYNKFRGIYKGSYELNTLIKELEKVLHGQKEGIE